MAGPDPPRITLRFPPVRRGFFNFLALSIPSPRLIAGISIPESKKHTNGDTHHAHNEKKPHQKPIA